MSSLSNDFYPQMLRGEDGVLRAFWISNRRGLGWELWTSRRHESNATWQSATRVPLEQFAADQKNSNHLATELLHYGVTQDRRGRWIVAVVREQGRKWIAAAQLRAIDREYWRIICTRSSRACEALSWYCD